MIFSAKCEYAIRAMLELASTEVGTPLQSRLVASHQGIPEGFLEQIMLDLRRANLVDSVRGSRGGYLLSRPARNISLAEVVQAIDGPLQAGAAWHGPHEGEASSALVLSEVWATVRAGIVEVLSTMDLAALCEVARRADAAVPSVQGEGP
ncbi:MAG: RrF2 family transcriptional regulator [Candidatus Dormibacteria bacterium]